MRVAFGGVLLTGCVMFTWFYLYLSRVNISPMTHKDPWLALAKFRGVDTRQFVSPEHDMAGVRILFSEPLLTSPLAWSRDGVRARWVLINYAAHCCDKTQLQNCRTGLSLGGFDMCVMFGPDSLDPVFYTQHQHILEKPRGAGYWMWKPYVIWNTLQYVAEGDFVMYSDVGVDFIQPISPLIDIILKTNQSVLPFRIPFREHSYTKRDTFILLDADNGVYNTTWQRCASFVVLRNDQYARRFVSQWMTYSMDARAITDQDNVLGEANYPDFIDHRHDQSIFSLLSKKWGLQDWPDISQHGRYVEDRDQGLYPVLVHHHRDRT